MRKALLIPMLLAGCVSSERFVRTMVEEPFQVVFDDDSRTTAKVFACVETKRNELNCIDIVLFLQMVREQRQQNQRDEQAPQAPIEDRASSF